MSDSPNRIGPLLSVASPTGSPVLPVPWVPWLTGLVGIAGVVSQLIPEHTIGSKIAQAIVAIGAVLGLASPGWRTK